MHFPLFLSRIRNIYARVKSNIEKKFFERSNVFTFCNHFARKYRHLRFSLFENFLGMGIYNYLLFLFSFRTWWQQLRGMHMGVDNPVLRSCHLHIPSVTSVLLKGMFYFVLLVFSGYIFLFCLFKLCFALRQHKKASHVGLFSFLFKFCW